jgi:lysophospholipase L1-like esterase
MKPIFRFALAGFAFCAALDPTGAAAMKVVLAGDSTMTIQKGRDDRPDLAGWGMFLHEFLTPEAEVVNLARSGASSKSFRELGLWERVLAEKGDWVIIQFGHNDQPGKGGRSTDAGSTFRENLARYTREAGEGGARVVLVTPVARRVYDEQGRLKDTLADYVAAVIATGEQEECTVVDLHRLSFALFDHLGESLSRRYGPSDTDRTHFSSAGARLVARLVAEELSRVAPEAAQMLRLEPEPPAGLPFDLSRAVASQGFDGETCWVHPRAGAIPGAGANGGPAVVMTMQKLVLTGSDLFLPLNSLRTNDLGASWSAPREFLVELGRRQEEDGVEVGVCDFTPKWHAATGTLLGTGHTVRYKDNRVMEVRRRETAWSVYDPDSDSWAPWQTLKMPADEEFANSGAGSVQRVDLEDGTILLPVYHKVPAAKDYSVTVLRCAFDGATLRLLERGDPVTVNGGRGLYEPSLIRRGGEFFLTLRNDQAGHVCRSRDGLRFSEPRPWRFDDGEALGNVNTQTHWVSGRGGLFLAYTRTGANNDHVFRGRAPLFLGQVDPATLTVRRATECVLVPEHGARLGNFAVCEVSDDETWVTVSEWMQDGSPRRVIPPGHPLGADNRVWIARLRWH